MDTLARAPGGQMRGAATKSMSDIAEERQQRRYAPFAAAPLRAAAHRAAGRSSRWLCCSLLTYRPGYCSSLAPRQRAWGPAAKCSYYFFTDPKPRTIGAGPLETCAAVTSPAAAAPTLWLRRRESNS